MRRFIFIIMMNFITILFFLSSFFYWRAANAQNLQYVKLNEYLLKYEEMKKNSGWQTIRYNKNLSIGFVDKSVSNIKKRLIITGELNCTYNTNDTFDLSLLEAVKLFQENHGIPVNGVVDHLTLQEMNIPVTARIYQILINIRRWKEYIIMSSEPYIYINIATQKLYFISGDSTLLQMNVVVGRPSRKTPELNSIMSQVEFNPTWVIPPGIMKKDILPRIKQNPSFISHNSMKVYLGSLEIDSKRINWDSVSLDHSPYTIIQSPGPKNPMGRLKFLFPNKYFVYMHDTPDTVLLNRSIRTYSSGCIRLANAKGLVDHLLKMDKGWSSDMIDSLMTSRQNIKVRIDNPVKILVSYHTAWVNSNGELQFARDIYRKDY